LCAARLHPVCGKGPELQAGLRHNNFACVATTNARFGALIMAEIRKLTEIARAANISLD
jgi:hypothetical protein